MWACVFVRVRVCGVTQWNRRRSAWLLQLVTACSRPLLAKTFARCAASVHLFQSINRDETCCVRKLRSCASESIGCHFSQPTFATKKLSTGANGQKEDAASLCPRSFDVMETWPAIPLTRLNSIPSIHSIIKASGALWPDFSGIPGRDPSRINLLYNSNRYALEMGFESQYSQSLVTSAAGGPGSRCGPGPSRAVLPGQGASGPDLKFVQVGNLNGPIPRWYRASRWTRLEPTRSPWEGGTNHVTTSDSEISRTGIRKEKMGESRQEMGESRSASRIVSLLARSSRSGWRNRSRQAVVVMCALMAIGSLCPAAALVSDEKKRIFAAAAKQTLPTVHLDCYDRLGLWRFLIPHLITWFAVCQLCDWWLGWNYWLVVCAPLQHMRHQVRLRLDRSAIKISYHGTGCFVLRACFAIIRKRFISEH